MPSDVLITPASSKIDFTDGANATKTLKITGTSLNIDTSFAIGATTANNTLSVLGSASIGSSYNVAGPTNGLIVQGDVGIGTNSPSNSKLHIVGDWVNGHSTVKVQGITGNTTGYGFYDTAGSRLGYLAYTGAAFEWYNNVNVPIIFYTNTSERMRIAADGKVGIGTTSPTQKLDIVGSYATAGDSSGILKIRGGATGGDTQLNFGVSADGGYGWIQATDVGITNNINIVLNPIGGNVGIGATVASAKLHVAGTTGLYQSAGSTYLYYDHSGVNTWRTGIFTDNTSSYIIGHDAGGTFATKILTITMGGNVGIGTTNPSSSLHVSKAGNTSGGTILMGLSNDGAAKWSYLVSTQYNSSSNAKGFSLIGGYTDASSNVVAIGGSIYEANPATELQFYTHTAVTHATGGTRRMTINTNGNVGIGYTNPAYLLDVNGVARINGNFNITGGGDLGIFDSDGTGTFYSYMNAGVGYIRIDDGSSANGKLDINNSLLYIQQAGGNVGVGTNNPTSKLHVWNGTVRVSGFQSIAAGPLTFLRSDYNGSAAVQINFLNINPSNGYDSDLGIQLMNTAGSMVDVMRVKGSTGNVGIGVINPLAQLHINEATSGAAALRVDGTNGTLFSVIDDLSDSLMSVNNSAGLPVLEVFADDRVVMGQYGANDFVLRSNKIGVGTNNPNDQLTFAQVDDDAIQIRRRTVSQGGPATGTGISWTWTSATTDTETWAAVRAIFPGNSDSHLTFSTRNTSSVFGERMRIQNDGNVGINTASPAYKLDVNGTSAFRDTVNIGPNIGTITWGNFGGGTGFGVRSESGRALSFGANGSFDHLVINTSGNVGVGTASPTVKLDIASTQGNGIVMRYDTGTAYQAWIRPYWNSGTDTRIDFAINRTANVTPDVIMSVGYGGNVGINTTTPSRRLQVNGDVAFATNSGGLIIASYDGDTPNLRPSVANGSILISDDSGSVNRGTEFLNGGGIVIQSLSGFTPLDVRSNSASLLFVTSAGNVGIGTTVPTAYAGYTSLTIGNPNSIGLIKLRSAYSSGNGAEIYQTGSGHLLLNINSSLTSMYLKVDGNVGVGTVNPLSKLAVDGVTSVGPSSKLSLIGLDINSGATPTYVKIVTTIPFASASADFTVNIKGFIYGASRNADISISWHYYLSTFYNPIAKSSGGWAPTIRLSAEGGFVAIVLSSPGYWPKFYVESMYSSAYSNQYSSGWSWVDADATGSPIVNVPYASNFGNNFVMLTDGNVGVGTASPSRKLHVYSSNLSDNTVNPLLLIDGKFTAAGVDSNDIVGIAFRVENSAGGSQTTTCIGSSYQGAGNALLLQPVSGNVGVGTINPSFKFEIGAGTSNVVVAKLTQGYERVRYYGFDLLGYNDGNLWMIGNNATNGLILGSNWDWDAQAGIYYTPGTYGAAGGSLEIGQLTKNNANFTHGNTRFYTNGVERLRIISNGYVGIGASSPTYKLQIGTVGSLADSIRIGTYLVAKNTRQYIGYTRDDSGLFESAGNGDSPSTVLGGVAGIRIVNTTGTLASAYADNSVQLLTHIFNGGSRVALHANYDGNIGIGTSIPAVLLQIGTGSPTSATGGLQFGDDTGTRLYRSSSGVVTCSGTIAATFSGNLTGNVTGNVTGNASGSSTFVASLGVLNYDNDRTTKRAGLSHYTGYSTGTNRPTTYDYTLQVTNGTSGWEISMDWIATTGPAIYARSLRDCCQNWSSWVRILDSANYSFAANMNQNVRTTDGVTFAGITGNGQLNINHSTPTAVARLWSGGSTVWSLGVGDASGSYFNISADFGSFTINKTNGYVGIGTTSQTTRLQLGSGTPTASADGIQFGGDTSARLYRSSPGVVSASNSFSALGGFVYASNYLQTGGNLIYPASFSATQRLEIGNAAQNAWITGISIAPGGNVVVAGTLTESSSIRYKENIETISAPILPKLNKIRPVTYNKKDNPKHIEYGIIAEELNELFPEFVNKNESGEVESVNYSRLTVILIKAVKELQEEVEKLKNK
jgi:hypothetical protein